MRGIPPPRSRYHAHAQYSTRGNEGVYFYVGKSAKLSGRLGGLQTLRIVPEQIVVVPLVQAACKTSSQSEDLRRGVREPFLRQPVE